MNSSFSLRRLRFNPIVAALLVSSLPVIAHAQAQAQTPAQVAVQPTDTTQAPSAESAAALPQVEVKAAGVDGNVLPGVAPGGQAATGARLGILGNTSILDAPVSVNAYTSQLMHDQQASTLGDVLQNDASVRFTTNSGHLLENFTVRGLELPATDIATNGLYGIAPASHVPVEMLERVEVLRGPSALLSGIPPSSSVGGSINLVTKRAGPTPLTEITTSYSSHSYGQVQADVSRRFGSEQRLGLRVNAAYGKGEAGVEDQEKGRRLGAVALDWQGDSARVWLDAYTSRETIDNGSPAMFNFVQGIGRLLTPPPGDINLYRNTHGIYKNNGAMLRGELDLNSQWQAYAAFGGSEGNGDGLLFGTRSIVTGADGTAKGYVYNVSTQNRRSSLDTGLIGNFQTGSIQHRLQLAYNLVRFKEATSNRANAGYPQNIYDPITPVFPAAPADPKYTVDNKLQSLVVADTLNMLNGKLLLTLGARLQKVEQPIAKYSAQRLSPALGIVVKPWGEDTSLYANYMQGLQPGQTVGTGYANEGETFKPMQTKQIEAGVKFRRGGLTQTVSAFQIERPTLIARNNTIVDGGKQRVRGVEWSAFGEVVDNLAFLGGVSYNRARQINTGLDSYAAPQWTGNMGLTWTTPIQGLKAGARVVYTGTQWSDSGNKIRVPSWHRFDINAQYATRIANTPVRFNAAIENLADKRYWSGIFNDGFVMPGAPRTFKLAATVSF